MKKVLGAALLAVSALALTAGSASAHIVCNEEGACWRVKVKHEYKPEHHVQIHDDDWKWADEDSKRYRWHEHTHGDDRGYYGKGGIWIGF